MHYTGVYYRENDDVWTCCVTVHKKPKWLGTYDDEYTALRVRDCAIRHFGLETKRYFADHELTSADFRLLYDSLERKQGEPRPKDPRDSKTSKKMMNKALRRAKLEKKFKEIQKLIPT